MITPSPISCAGLPLNVGNPMEYHVWGAVEKNTNGFACKTMAELMSWNAMRNACSKLWNHLDIMTEGEGDYSELDYYLPVIS